ncbi:transcriptional regulator [Rhodoferax koreense]|uniref:Transcriptional regulator n=2 Tax=Rhodoferax koreensis TaxID=1842727 RepID=A0A1P8JTZ8_9BURK|nr:transcriptional regulator [Rhodoferax koreense]
MKRIDKVIDKRHAIRRGEFLYRQGDVFESLYAIRLGHFKTSIGTPDGRVQVTGFQMAGEVIGFDGIVGGRHSCDAVALEDAQVCKMPFNRMEELSRDIPSLQHHIHRLLGREIVRDQGVMLLLGAMSADERVATFLLNLVQRLHARGFAQTELVLRMTREDIGSYLGLTLETVSRTFSRFAAEGILLVKQRQIQILSTAGLRRVGNLDDTGADAAPRPLAASEQVANVPLTAS